MEEKTIFNIIQWTSAKIRLTAKDKRIMFKDGEVWWCHIGYNLGQEIYGKGLDFTRPVLIFKKFSPSSFLGLPITSKEKQGTWFVAVEVNESPRWVLLNQGRIYDKKRLQRKISILGDADWACVKKRFGELYMS